MDRSVMRMVAVVAATGVVAGCGGGGGGSKGGGDDGAVTARADRAAATYRAELREYAGVLRAKAQTKRGLTRLPDAPPVLPDVDGSSPAYDRATAVAERVGPIDAELRAMVGSDPGDEARLYNRLYTISGTLWSATFDADNDADFAVSDLAMAQTDRYIQTGKVTKGFDAGRNRLQARMLRRVVKATTRARRKVRAERPRTPIQRSVLAFQAAEYAETIAAARTAQRDIEAAPRAASSRYSADLMEGRDDYPIGLGAVSRHGKAFTRGLVRDIGTLAREDAVTAGSPLVGDRYREQVVAGLRKPRQVKTAAPQSVTDRLWMLWRIRELERTPDAAYDAARQTVLQFNVGDPRSRFEALLLSVKELQTDGIAYEPAEKRELQRQIRWITRELSRPIAPVLAPTRTAYLRELSRWPLDGGILELLEPQRRAVKRATRIVRTATRRLDSAKLMRRQLARTVAATRPNGAT